MGGSRKADDYRVLRRRCNTMLFYFLANDPTSGPATEPRYYYEVKNARGKPVETLFVIPDVTNGDTQSTK